METTLAKYNSQQIKKQLFSLIIRISDGHEKITHIMRNGTALEDIIDPSPTADFD